MNPAEKFVSHLAKSKSFRSVMDGYDWDAVVRKIHGTTVQQVKRALARAGSGEPEDFMAFVSPAAVGLLEDMALLSRDLTRRRFGNTVQMYIPLYLSNECNNICTYCGFSYDHRIDRITLNEKEVMEEVRVIKEMGYDHVLLVTGESSQQVGVEYFERMVRLIRPYFSGIMLEVQPLEQEEYERLIEAGIDTVLVYQETYHETAYRQYHVKGRKKNFNYRLETPDRLGRAGIRRIGLGVLLGLEDWRADAFFTAVHLNYLEKRYWKTRYSISFPRLRPAVGCFPPKSPVSDRQLVQLICAFRLFNENVELSLSTREPAAFRDHVCGLGITAVSAGSRTSPGAYASAKKELEQFEISDERSAAEVAAALRRKGLDPVWKDWDRRLIKDY